MKYTAEKKQDSNFSCLEYWLSTSIKIHLQAYKILVSWAEVTVRLSLPGVPTAVHMCSQTTAHSRPRAKLKLTLILTLNLLFLFRRPNDPKTSCYQQWYLLSIAVVLATFMSTAQHCLSILFFFIFLLFHHQL